MTGGGRQGDINTFIKIIFMLFFLLKCKPYRKIQLENENQSSTGDTHNPRRMLNTQHRVENNQLHRRVGTLCRNPTLVSCTLAHGSEKNSCRIKMAKMVFKGFKNSSF